MSINTSPLQYNKNGMDIDTWNSYLHSYGLSGKNLVMEITRRHINGTDPGRFEKPFTST